MMNFKKKNKIIITSLVLLIYLNHRHHYKPEYRILPKKEEAYASYEDGLIYIGNKNYIDNIIKKDGDILIEDRRFDDDPDMVICNSCKVTDKELRNEILEVICKYEKDNNSNWDRSIESMRVEWFMHNLCYRLKYKTDHTMDVNLNNEDEEKYNNKILQLIFKI